jgi:proteasome lid subunit RPN8/RPN11
MIEIEEKPWQTMLVHAERTYPNECCGAMLGHSAANKKVVTEAVALDNAWNGAQGDRYQVRPEDLLEAEKKARAQGLDLIGIFHSHPDADAYFSETDLKNSCPWYSFVSSPFRTVSSITPAVSCQTLIRPMPKKRN